MGWQYEFFILGDKIDTLLDDSSPMYTPSHILIVPRESIQI
jgi:hypothetical protein